MRRHSLLIGFFLLAASAAYAAPPATAPATAPAINGLPSTADLQQMLDDKKFQQVIQLTSRLLAMKGAASANYNRFDLLKLKAEAQLQRGDPDGAIATFSELARVTNDPHDRDVVQAMLYLIKRSPRGKYTPRTVPVGKDKAQPIDILDPLTRKAALDALFNDERAVVEPKLKQAMNSQSLPPVLPVIQAIMSLKSLDVAASDNDQRTTDLTSELVKHAKKLMTVALLQMDRRQADIVREASTEQVTNNVVITNGLVTPVTSRNKAGLSDRNVRELKEMIDTCTKMQPFVQSLASVGGSDANMDDVTSASDRVQAKAKDILDTRFDSGGGAGPTIGK